MLEFASEYGYAGLFLASFLAATILPLSSEVVFTALLYSGLDTWTCIYVATAGNWLGGMSCYYLGRLGKFEWLEKYFRIKQEKVENFANKIHNRGDWLAFFAFLPAVGDLIAVAAGFLRCNVWIVSFSMLLGKFLRYIVWLYVSFEILKFEII